MLLCEAIHEKAISLELWVRWILVFRVLQLQPRKLNSQLENLSNYQINVNWRGNTLRITLVKQLHGSSVTLTQTKCRSSKSKGNLLCILRVPGLDKLSYLP
jgi:hypothetical protein